MNVRCFMLLSSPLAATGAGGFYRGYKVALAKGLFLNRVHFAPGVDDPTRLLYPDMAHDEMGRLLDFLPADGSADDAE